MEFRFRWDAEKISPMARPRARARKSYITWQVDFCQFRPILAQMCFGFLWANLFLWASTSHVQGSISNARGHNPGYINTNTADFLLPLLRDVCKWPKKKKITSEIKTTSKYMPVWHAYYWSPLAFSITSFFKGGKEAEDKMLLQLSKPQSNL